MPRYIAHVRQFDGHAEAIDCDDVHVDDDGHLRLNLAQHSADNITVGRFAHGAWASYMLEPAPQVEPETYYGYDDCAPCNTEPEKAETLPEPGDVVHIHQADRPTCLFGPVTKVGPNVLEVEAGDDPRYPRYVSIHHDETRTIHGSWHWPCEGDAAKDTEPEPDAPAPQIVVHVHGSVLSERDLDQAIQRAWRRASDISRYTRR